MVRSRARRAAGIALRAWGAARSHAPRPRSLVGVDERPSIVFYAVAFTALALLVAGLILSVQNDDAAIAGAATGVGVIGLLLCGWMLKRG
jgi:hypothetical protein